MNIRRFGAKQIIPISMLVVGIVFLTLGLQKYGFWSDTKGPRPGFFPVIMAVLLIAMSVLLFFQSFKEEQGRYPLSNWLVALGGIGIFAASFLIGFIPAIGAYVIVWLKVYEKCTWKLTLISFGVIMAIIVGTFVLWLGVPFPNGLILDAIIG